MSNHKITAASRKDEGKGASRRLRHAGSIPAIIYGGDAAPQSIQLDQEKIWVASQHEWFYSSILDLEVDGKVQAVLLRDMQRHPYKQVIMHLDFQRVNANEAIRVNVPLHLVNADQSPAGKSAGVVLTQEMNEVEVTCLPGKLPESIEVDLSNMEVGDTVHLSDVVLPEGVELVAKIDDEHNPAVAVARHARVEAEPEAGEAAEAPDADVPASKQDDAEGEGAE
ncbi:50S ribosomal protein L25/general stress protein Ctc [Luteimonas arsenica]|uniref:50S ribosomal protein L25/general stress protein Ctc n=1 Tax=Luteimonas arsenica TaxID=1586242 RepID=UPI0010547895|nr:50S ribosomal protein L25/general stress protein Ctc [Luteimonas arsenica]